MSRYCIPFVPTDFERAISQVFWFAARRALLRAVTGMTLALVLVVWPLQGFAIEAPSAEMKVILLVFALFLGAAIALHFMRTRRVIRAVRRTWDDMPFTLATPLTMTIVIDDAGMDAAFSVPGPAMPEPPRMRPWQDVTEVWETRDFLCVVAHPPLPPLPKRGLDPRDLAGLRDEIAAHRAATPS